MSKKQLIFKIVIRIIFIVVLVVCFIFGCKYSKAETFECSEPSVPPVTLQPWFEWTPMPDYTPVPTVEPSLPPDSSEEPLKSGVKYVPHNTQLYVSNYSTYFDEQGNTKYSYYKEENGLKYVSDDAPSSVLHSYSENTQYVPYWFGELPLSSCVFHVDISAYMNKNPIQIPSTGEFIYSLEFYGDFVRTYFENALYINVPYFVSLDIQYVGSLNGEPVYLYDTLFPVSTGSSSLGLSSASRDLVGVMDVLTFVRFKLHIIPDTSDLSFPDTENISCKRFKYRFKDFSNLSQSFEDQMSNLFVPSGNELSNALGNYMDTYSNDAMAGTFTKVISYLQAICDTKIDAGSSNLVLPPLSVKIKDKKYYYFKGGTLNLSKGNWTSGGVVDPNDPTVFFPATTTPFGDDDTTFSITSDIFLYLRSFNSVLISFGFCNLMVDMIFRYRNGSRFYLSDKEMHELS